MGKKKAAAGLGRALQRERGRARGGLRAGDGWRHASESGGGAPARPGPESVTEQSSLEEFLATAALAGTRFAAEKLDARLVPARPRPGLLTAEEAREARRLQEQHQHFLCIPRRPRWDKQTSPEMLNQAERDGFLEWRRRLAQLEEEQKLLLTPFERNLEFWRQLWRVLERSDVVVQIVDARNPLLFRCPDLERYVKELSPAKENLVLLNKADLLSEEQRSAWARFFEGEGVRVVFWSALAEERRLAAGLQEMNTVELLDPSQEELQAAHSSGGGRLGSSPWPPGYDEHDSSQEDVYEDCEEDAWLTCSEDEAGGAGVLKEKGSCDAEVQEPGLQQGQPIRNSSCLVSRDELLEILKAVHTGKTVRNGEVTLGLVGYPNVGKSSTINTILGKKKVSVSATPGHTKHFQTLYVEPGLCLCDCPGLVMPSFVSTKAEMTCSGILPIDQLRDHVPPVSLVCQRIPRRVLEATYGINIVRPREDDAPDRPPTAEELLTAYGCMRGFMTDHGQVDQPRSARCVLKDYVKGKLLYCHPPPGVDPKDFQSYQERNGPSKNAEGGAEVQPGENPKAKQIENVVDKAFFHQENVRALTRGVQAVMGSRAGVDSPPVLGQSPGKPWKKHGNRNKKEKIRRVTKHLEA
ncbi:large subunit GTPase 1 homolog [Tiliqua scincoides]|uniref:large subunit GTPase 1 homolog n=1 Tax=Tiliqua scincoides TaxID=71010 RepID=UPI003461D992